MSKADVTVKRTDAKQPRTLAFKPAPQLPEGFRQLTKKYGQKFLQKFPDILKPPPEKLKETRINHDDIRYFPIYSKQKHAYQADLTFYKVAVKDGYYINRPILCLININTRFAAAWPLEYTLKSKEDVDADWEPDETRERGKKRKISSADTSEPPSLKLLKQVQTKTSANTLKALLSCLIYLYHHGNQVDVVYSDDGKEFKGEVQEFCNNTRLFLQTHPHVHEEIRLKERKMFAQEGKKQYRNKNLVFKMLPDHIRWNTFNPNEGSKRRTGIVERFNRTLKGLLRKITHDPETRQVIPGIDLEEALLYVLGTYNMIKNHRTMFETMNPGLHYNPKHDTPVTPHTMSIPYKDPDADNGETVDPEDILVDKMKRKTRDVWEYYDTHKKFKNLKRDAVVLTKKVESDGKLFKKRFEDKIHRGIINKQQGNTLVLREEGNTFNVLKRRYLPWELSLLKKPRSEKEKKRELKRGYTQV